MLDIRQRTGYLFLAVLVGHVILISAQVQSRSGVRVLEAVTFGFFSRVQAVTSGGINGVRGAWGNYFALLDVREENERLRQQMAELEVRLHEQRALAARTSQLQELLDLQAATTLPTIAAQIIAGNPNPGVRTVTIDRGSSDGLQENMAVIAPGGVVGRVIGPLASRAARVQFLVHGSAAAGALIERTRVGGMIVGVNREPPLMLELISNLADVQVGDLVVASGVDGIYPTGFAIGTVVSARRGDGLYQDITVRPAVSFSALEEVLVVLVPARGVTPLGDPEGGR
ncbi:MAG: rod shape-determining protein MreC [Acidobacteria bacterium]|nr:rod shape-determining protein MreC [Acidobacteriota bacterium]MBA3888146.1 rod shape-determining protein MreC [Acidobacteriota bacterium]